MTAEYRAHLREQAREKITVALCNDFADSLGQDRNQRLEIARNGHTGFNDLKDFELIRAAKDADLDQDPEISEAIAILE